MEAKKTLMLGATDNPQRYAYLALEKLLRYNHPVVGIGRKDTQALGIDIHKSLTNFPDIHTITLYLNPTNQKPYYNYIIDLHPKRVIFNPGTENPELYQILKEKGIDYEEACTLVLLGTHQY